MSTNIRQVVLKILSKFATKYSAVISICVNLYFWPRGRFTVTQSWQVTLYL